MFKTLIFDVKFFGERMGISVVLHHRGKDCKYGKADVEIKNTLLVDVQLVCITAGGKSVKEI